MYRDGKPIYDIEHLISLYLYLMQPGGSGEEILSGLRTKGELPGITEGGNGWFSKWSRLEDLESQTFPLSCTLEYLNAAIPTRLYYTVTRASPASDWKLVKAWRAAADGHVLAEFPVP